MGSFFSGLWYNFTNLFYPHPDLPFQDWQQICETLCVGILAAAVIGCAVFVISAKLRMVSEPSQVFELHKPLRWGIVIGWCVVIVWAIISIIYVARDQWSVFINIKPFLFVAVCGSTAWLLQAVLNYLICRRPEMARYRFVTFLGRLFPGGA